MRIKDYKCKCGCIDFMFHEAGNQVGIYCNRCGKWLRWANKDERNLMNKICGNKCTNNDSTGSADNSTLKQKICEDMIHDNRIGRRSLEAILEILDKYMS